MNLWGMVKKGFMNYPDNVCLVHGDQQVTYREFEQQINKLTNALRELGLKKGDAVSILGENSIMVLAAQYALIKSGMIWAPLNFRNHPNEHAHYLNNAESKAVILQEQFAEGITSIRDQVRTCKHFIADGNGYDGMLKYDDLMNGADDKPFLEDVDENDIMGILHTSGTTGKAKGVVHTHRNWTFMAMMVRSMLDIRETDVALYIAPVSHGSGALVPPHLMMGVKNVLVSHMDIDLILSIIQKEKISTMWLAPTIIYFLLAWPTIRDYDFSLLRNLCYSSAPMAVEKLKEALDVFGHTFIQAYGLVECPIISILEKQEHIVEGSEEQVQRLGSAGREYLLTDIRTIDDEGASVPPGEKGEIIVRSPLVMREYWKNPEATASSIKDGWLHTGDMGYLDEEGYLFIADRKKDMVITGGYNVYPKEVEEVIYKHPSVFETAVIGVPDEMWGESIKACVVLKPGMEATEEEVIALCKENLASYKKPKSVDFMDALPKNLTGKILKAELREKYWQGRERQV